MTCLDRIRDALLGVTPNVFHFYARKARPPYVVWAEDGESVLFADGVAADRVMTGTVDLFTAAPEDTVLFESVQAALSAVCAFRLNSIQYEDDTGLTHYEWAWEVTG